MNQTILDVRSASRGSYDGKEFTVQDNLTKLVGVLFVPESFRYRERSKYQPHQGQRECLRRQRRIMKEYAIG